MPVRCIVREQTNYPLWTVCKIKHIKAEAFRRIFLNPNLNKAKYKLKKYFRFIVWGSDAPRNLDVRKEEWGTSTKTTPEKDAESEARSRTVGSTDAAGAPVLREQGLWSWASFESPMRV